MQTISQLDKHTLDVCQIVEDVFRTMLGLEVQRVSFPLSLGADQVTAAIHFAGAWKGAVLLECTKQQAFEFTSRLMGVAAPASMTDDVRDSMGELTNMVAGNLKSILTPGVGLSMPSILEGSDYALRICGGNIAFHQTYTGDLGPFRITLVEVLEHGLREPG